jgi:hypothetical protein
LTRFVREMLPGRVPERGPDEAAREPVARASLNLPFEGRSGGGERIDKSALRRRVRDRPSEIDLGIDELAVANGEDLGVAESPSPGAAASNTRSPCGTRWMKSNPASIALFGQQRVK